MVKEVAKRGGNRRRGCDAERKYAKIFREMGFSACRCSRQTSRLLDACKVDLDGLPFDVQVKMGRQRVNYRQVLREMHDGLAVRGMQGENRMSLVLHEFSVGSGNRRNRWDVIVAMPFEDFKNLITGKSKYICG